MSLDVQFLSKTARYAIAAATTLAELDGEERMSSADLADRTGVPKAFLGKVLTQLARAGLIDGLKGHGGGYRLARPAMAIRLQDLVVAIGDESGHLPTPCALGALACDPHRPCAVHEQWSQIRGSLGRLMASVTVADAAAGQRALLPRVAGNP